GGPGRHGRGTDRLDMPAALEEGPAEGDGEVVGADADREDRRGGRRPADGSGQLTGAGPHASAAEFGVRSGDQGGGPGDLLGEHGGAPGAEHEAAGAGAQPGADVLAGGGEGTGEPKGLAEPAHEQGRGEAVVVGEASAA